MSTPSWAQRLRAARKSAGMTQEAVAEKLGVEQTTISRYEIGQLAVPVERLIALLDLYGVPSEERAAFLVADEPASIEAA